MPMVDKPYSQACENNKRPILGVLQGCFALSTKVLEIGAGTGQHAVFFASHMPHLKWQPSDQPENLPGIRAWMSEYTHNNLLPAIELDVDQDHWPTGYDAIFSANTAHIMAWPTTQKMLRRVAEILPSGGIFALYGPFNYNGTFTTDSNRDFDAWLKSEDPERGIRDFEKVNEIARKSGLNLLADQTMPANNRMLVWQRS